MIGWKAKVMKLGIGTLVIGWLIAPAQATTGTGSAQPAISEVVAGVVIDITTQLLIGYLQNNAANDNAEGLKNNTWHGWQMMGPCNKSTGYVNTVSNALGPCAPNLAEPQFGIGFQETKNLSAADCAFKQANATQAIQGTIVPGLLALAGFTPRPDLGNLYPGGVCDQGGNNRFTGIFMHAELLYVGDLSNATCAWMFAQCTGECSCGLLYRPN